MFIVLRIIKHFFILFISCEISLQANKFTDLQNRTKI